MYFLTVGWYRETRTKEVQGTMSVLSVIKSFTINSNWNNTWGFILVRSPMNATSATSGLHKAETEQSIGEFMDFLKCFMKYLCFLWNISCIFYSFFSVEYFRVIRIGTIKSKFLVHQSKCIYLFFLFHEH